MLHATQSNQNNLLYQTSIHELTVTRIFETGIHELIRQNN